MKSFREPIGKDSHVLPHRADAWLLAPDGARLSWRPPPRFTGSSILPASGVPINCAHVAELSFWFCFAKPRCRGSKSEHRASKPQCKVHGGLLSGGLG